MIGIMSAMDDEIKLLIEDLILEEKKVIANREYLRGTLYEKEVVLALSRWGKVAASQTATTLINLFPIDSLIFTGVAGAAAPELEIGDIVISSELVQHDVDASPVPPMKRFEIPLLGISHFKADPALTDRALRSAEYFITHSMREQISEEHLASYGITTPSVVHGLIGSGDQFIASAITIGNLRSSLETLQCIEMEGAAVAQVCYEHSIPFVVIRALSDKADHNATIDFPMFVKHVAAHYSKGIIGGMLGAYATVE